jgi:hypothetical protein
MSPTQTTELFAILDKLFTTARDSLLPSFIASIRLALTTELRSRFAGFRELLAPSLDPSNYVALSPVAVEFPRDGEWRQLYEQFVSSYIGAGLLTGNQHLLLLVIAALTRLCTEGGEVSSKCAPFIARGLAQVEAGRPSTVLVTFAYHFCFVQQHSKYGQLIDGFVDVFTRLRNYLDAFIAAHIQELWNPQQAAVSLNAVNSYCATFTTPFAELFRDILSVKDKADELEWVQQLSKKIGSALKLDTRLGVRLMSFDGLVQWVALLGSDELRAAVPEWQKAGSWGPMLRLMKGRVRHELFHTFVGTNQELVPRDVLEEISGWGDEDMKPDIYQLVVGPIRRSILEWLKDDTPGASESAQKVLAGLWRFSAI